MAESVGASYGEWALGSVVAGRGAQACVVCDLVSSNAWSTNYRTTRFEKLASASSVLAGIS